jgi:hypothetical protein
MTLENLLHVSSPLEGEAPPLLPPLPLRERAGERVSAKVERVSAEVKKASTRPTPHKFPPSLPPAIPLVARYPLVPPARMPLAWGTARDNRCGDERLSSQTCARPRPQVQHNERNLI